jgi:redox-regulated HSP33 family molecular chaperone
MSTLGAEELSAMQKENHRDVKCVNCGKVYIFSDQDFEDMLQMAKKEN